MFTCCSILFSDKVSLTEHLRYFHNSGSFPCVLCGVAFHSKSGLGQHYADGVHLVSPIAPTFSFQSSRRGLDLTDRFNYDQHNLLKLEQPGPATHALVRCNNCPRMFSTQQSLDQHCSAVHAAAPAVRMRNPIALEPTPCGKCHILFYTQESMDEHCTTMHPPGPPRESHPAALEPTPCGKCHILFYTQESMDEHCATMHSAVLPTHTHSHAALEPTPCGKCHILFYTQETMDRHCATVHPRTPTARARHPSAPVLQFRCSICGKRFINEYARDQHMVSAAHPDYVQQGRQRPVYKCKECARTFEVQDLLTLHAAGHVKQRLGR